MITLNSEKGLIKIESWDEIESRPGFLKDLNPQNEKLDSIIGRYVFKDKIHCGLSNCHSPHNKGYIVTTKDGHETNIGKDCGKTYFGVDFETLSKKFDRDVTEQENRETLWNFLFKLDETEKNINEIRSSKNGADWVHKFTQCLSNHNRGCPREIVRRISDMVKARNTTLFIYREATEQEIEELEIIENMGVENDAQMRKIKRPHYIDEPIAEISGLEALYKENNLRDLLVKDLESNINDFKDKDINNMTYEDLRYWAKWVGTVDNAIDKSLSIIDSGKKLLNEENLKPFLKILTDSDDIKLFRKFMRGLEKLVL